MSNIHNYPGVTHVDRKAESPLCISTRSFSVLPYCMRLTKIDEKDMARPLEMPAGTMLATLRELSAGSVTAPVLVAVNYPVSAGTPVAFSLMTVRMAPAQAAEPVGMLATWTPSETFYATVEYTCLGKPGDTTAVMTFGLSRVRDAAVFARTSCETYAATSAVMRGAIAAETSSGTFDGMAAVMFEGTPALKGAETAAGWPSGWNGGSPAASHGNVGRDL